MTSSIVTLKIQVTSTYLLLIADKEAKQSIPLLNATMTVKKNKPLIGPDSKFIEILTNGGKTIIEIHFKPLFDDHNLFKWNKAISDVLNEMLPRNQNQLTRIKKMHQLSSPLESYRLGNRKSVSSTNLSTESSSSGLSGARLSRLSMTSLASGSEGIWIGKKAKPPPKPVRKTLLPKPSGSSLAIPKSQF